MKKVRIEDVLNGKEINLFLSKVYSKDNLSEVRNDLSVGTCNTYKNILENYLISKDDELLNTISTKEYKSLQKVTTTLKTSKGEIEYTRRIYKNLRTGKYEYLLDEQIGYNKYFGQFTDDFVKMVINLVKTMSYRETARTINNITNITISHQAIGNILKKASEIKSLIIEDERNKLVKGDYIGKKVDVLFTEIDGTFVNIQGIGKRELKICKTYEGMKNEHKKGRPRNKAFNAHATCAMELIDFEKRLDTILNLRYDLEKSVVICGGDGAKWIKSSLEYLVSTNTPTNSENIKFVYQLDRFHIKKAITTATNNIEERVNINNYLEKHRTNKSNTFLKDCFAYIKTLIFNCEDEMQKERYQTLYIYLRNNRNNLKDYEQIVTLEPHKNKDVFYRNLGTMEGTMHIISKRLKRGRSWSVAGAELMAYLCCLNYSNTLDKFLDRLFDSKYHITLKERKIKNNNKKSNKNNKKSNYVKNSSVINKSLNKQFAQTIKLF